MDEITLNLLPIWALLIWLNDDCPLLAHRNPVVPQGYLSSFVQKSTCHLMNIFCSTNAPTPVGLLAEKGSRCRDHLALGNV